MNAAVCVTTRPTCVTDGNAENTAEKSHTAGYGLCDTTPLGCPTTPSPSRTTWAREHSAARAPLRTIGADLGVAA